MAIQLSKYKDRGNLHMKIRIKINTNVIFIFLFVCVIISLAITTFSAISITLKSIPYNNKTLSFYADCIKFHVKANGYANKVKDDVDNNLYLYSPPGPGRDLQPVNAKMQGYGNYVFKEDTSLFNFINFCYDINPQMTIACSVYNGGNELNSCDYTKLCTYTNKKLNSNSITFVNNFWTNMTNQLGEVFNSYQDLYFYDRYTNKGACLVFNPNKLESNGKEFLTCMMSYIFSNNQNSAFNFEVKKGDIVPFLYVKEHTDNNDIKNDPKEIAKFAYLANINGWSDTTTNDLWLEEYESVFGEYDEDALCELVEEDISTLAEWYTETDEKYQNQKGNKGNALLGSSIDEIIQSDYSIVQQLEATDYYLQTIEGIGDYKENMARNELMARYMMENSHISDIIKDYSVGIDFITENLQRGTSESKNTNTAVLSDFQVLEFDHRLDKDGQSDEDSLSDLTELTNNTKWVNITGPAGKMYVDMFSKGKTTKTQEAAFEDLVKKNPGMVKYEGGKLYYKTYDYDSNPMLNDTDFDGLNDDTELNNKYKTDGRFVGRCGEISRADYTNDFRYFFTDNDKYNDELAVMSLMIANDSYVNTNQVNANNIKQYIERIGFKDIWLKDSFKISGTETIRGKLYIGKKTIQVGANKKSVKRYKDVYGVFLSDFDNEINLKYLLANFNTDKIEEYYECISSDIESYVDSYISANPSNNSYCFWVTGYSLAGGIASHVSPYIIGKGETYTYTFGAPNTTKSGSTANINAKNIINEDDLIPKIINKADGYSRVGTLYNDSIYDNLQFEYKKLVGNFGDYGAYVKLANTIRQAIVNMRLRETTEVLRDRACQILARFLSNYGYLHDEVTMSVYPEIALYLNPKGRSVRSGHSINSYYVLAKSLNGFDLNNDDVGWTQLEAEPRSDVSHNETNTGYYYNRVVENALQNVGEWYVDNVYTYQAGNSKSNDVWKTEFYSKIQTKKNRGGLLALQKRIEHRDEYNANRTNDQPEFLDDNEMIQTRTNYEDPYMNAGAEVYKWKSGYAKHGHYKTDELNKSVGSDFDDFGDDCSTFAMAVLDYATKGDLYRNSSTITKAMYNAGDGSIKNNNYKTVLNELHFDYIPVTKTMTMDDLENGDLLITDGHYEFVIIGEDNSGTIGKRKRRFKQFGWGNVKGVYPDNNFNITKSTNESFYNQNTNPPRLYTTIIRLNNDGVRIYE